MKEKTVFDEQRCEEKQLRGTRFSIYYYKTEQNKTKHLCMFLYIWFKGKPILTRLILWQNCLNRH